MKKNKKTFLVTGGTGFIGSNICQLLIKKNYKVRVFDNNSRGSIRKINSIKNKIKFIKGDIRNKELLNKAMKNTDAVIHLAYVNGTKYFYSKPVLILDIAVRGILNVIEGCLKNNIKELYLASSSEVYQTPNKVPTDEKEILKIPDILRFLLLSLIISLSNFEPNNISIALTIRDFPDPVSPVITLKPSEKSTCILSMIAKFSIVSFFSKIFTYY